MVVWLSDTKAQVTGTRGKEGMFPLSSTEIWFFSIQMCPDKLLCPLLWRASCATKIIIIILITIHQTEIDGNGLSSHSHWTSVFSVWWKSFERRQRDHDIILRVMLQGKHGKQCRAGANPSTQALALLSRYQYAHVIGYIHKTNRSRPFVGLQAVERPISQMAIFMLDDKRAPAYRVFVI